MSLITILIWIGIILLLLMGIITAFMIYYWRVYKYRIRLFYKLSGDNQFHEGPTYKARKVMFSRGGVPRLYIPKLKYFVSYFGKKMKKNLFYYAEGPDGYLYNIVLGDLDTKDGVLDIEPIDKDVRDFHLANDKQIREEYAKPRNWPVILQSITIVLVLLLMFAGGWVLYDKMNEGLAQTNENLQTNAKVLELQEKMIVATQNLVEKLQGQQGGIKPA